MAQTKTLATVHTHVSIKDIYQEKFLKQKSGITLVALVITIIVLLILAGVAINVLFGEDGILNQAQKAKIETSHAAVKEQVILALKDYALVRNDTSGNETKDVITYLRNKGLLEEKGSYNLVKENLLNGASLGKGADKNSGDIYVIEKDVASSSTSETVYVLRYYETADKYKNLLAFNEKGIKVDIIENAKNYTVTFNTNGGNPIASQTVKEGNSANLPTDPKKDGFYFDDWYADSKLEDEFSFKTQIKSDITLYAKWIQELDAGYFEWATTAESATLKGFSPRGTTAYNNGEIVNLAIPSIYNELPVETIGESAFSRKDKLEKLYIPETVTNIRQYAFSNCSGLKEITMSATTIYDSSTYKYGGGAGYGSFLGCSSVEKVTLTGAGPMRDCGSDRSSYAFYGGTPWGVSQAEAIRVEIKPGVESIGMSAFRGGANIISIDVPDSVVSIEDEAFYGCSKVQEINLSNDVTKIGKSAFERCTALKSINLTNNITTLGNRAFYGCSSLESEINIPENSSITEIGDSTFEGCSKITKLYIPETVTNIRQYAFSNCSGLKEITMSATTIYDSSMSKIGGGTGYGSFLGCSSVEKVTLTGTGPMRDYETYTNLSNFYGGTPWQLSRATIKRIIIGAGITKIGNNAFKEFKDSTVFSYEGTEEQWRVLDKGANNTVLNSYTK